MTLFADTALLVLAAGRASRFGRDKLSEPLDGKPLATHLLQSVAPLVFAEKVVVAQGQLWCAEYAVAGFTIVGNAAPDRGMSASLHLGVTASSAPNLLVLLADMPFVSTTHLQRLGRAFVDGMGAPVVSVAPGYRGPPAMLPRALLLTAPAQGDEGARQVLKSAAELAAPAGELRDIDRVEDLAAAQSG